MSAPDPLPAPSVGVYDAPPDLLVGWGGGYTLPIPHPSLHRRRLVLSVFGASIKTPKLIGWLRACRLGLLENVFEPCDIRSFAACVGDVVQLRSKANSVFDS